MKALKLYTGTLLIICLAIVAGCNDNLTSPANSTSGSAMSTMETEISKNNTIGQENILNNLKFHRLITITPHQRYSFDYGNTGLRLFRAISIIDCEQISSKIEVYGYMDDERILLNCNSSGFSVFSIEIRNLTSDTLNLDVTLTGSGRIISVINNLELN